jgi:hypothetical protein
VELGKIAGSDEEGYEGGKFDYSAEYRHITNLYSILLKEKLTTARLSVDKELKKYTASSLTWC